MFDYVGFLATGFPILLIILIAIAVLVFEIIMFVDAI